MGTVIKPDFWVKAKASDLSKLRKAVGQMGASGVPRHKPKHTVDYVQELTLQLNALNLPLPVPEVQFFPGRKWRFDFAWPDIKLALEIEGGIWVEDNSAHRAPLKFINDMEKYNTAMLEGWRVIRVTPTEVKQNDGRAITLIEQAMRMK
jgi:hypothetical protein